MSPSVIYEKSQMRLKRQCSYPFSGSLHAIFLSLQNLKIILKLNSVPITLALCVKSQLL